MYSLGRSKRVIWFMEMSVRYPSSDPDTTARYRARIGRAWNALPPRDFDDYGYCFELLYGGSEGEEDSPVERQLTNTFEEAFDLWDNEFVGHLAVEIVD